MDETYFGGRFKAGAGNARQKEAIAAKSVIAGAVERQGNAKAEVAPNGRAKTVGAFLLNNVDPVGTRLLTDESNRYDNVARDYNRHTVNHGKKEYARGDVHVNSVETFFAHLKRSVRGTFKAISKQHLQTYLDAFVWHYNNRHSDSERFSVLLGALLNGVK